VGPEELIRQVAVPTLLVHDRDDVIIPYEQVRRIAAVRPDIELVTVSGFGHRRMLRDPALVQRCVEHAAGSATPNVPLRPA